MKRKKHISVIIFRIMQKGIIGFSVPKTLLEFSHEIWSAKSLARSSGVSLKTCYFQINNLLDRGLILEDHKGLFSVKDPLSLRQYLEDIHEIPKWSYYFSPDVPEYFCKRIDEVAREQIYVVTGELGLWSFHQHLQPLRTHLLIPKKSEHTWRRKIESELLAVKCPPTRATIFIRATNDPYPFLRTKKIGNYFVPPFIQVYLDCRALGARLAEGARDAWQLIMK
jgi:hypothetical protein